MRAVLRTLGLCALLFPATVPAEQWSMVYGTEGDARLGRVAATASGGYVVAANRQNDAWVFEIDRNGGILWQRAFQRYEDSVGAISSTPDGGTLVAGSTYFVQTPTSSYRLGWVQKLDRDGRVDWQRFSDTQSSYADVVRAQPDSTGGALAVGWILSSGSVGAGIQDALAVRFDAGGNVLWGKTYGGAGNDYASSVRETADGGYIVIGSTASFGATAAPWILKLDAEGDVVWQKAYPGTRPYHASRIATTPGGGYIVAGSAFRPGTDDADAWVMKLDGAGEIVWQKTYGGDKTEYALAVQPNADGGYVVAGFTRSFGAGNDDAWLLGLDGSGNVVWQRTYGGPGYDSANDVLPAGDGGYLVVGSTMPQAIGNSAGWILKVAGDGAIGGCASVGRSDAVVRASDLVAKTTTATVTRTVPAPNYMQMESYLTDTVPTRQCHDPTPAARPNAVEYYHREFDHYFVTTLPQEIAALDAGLFTGWARTGQGFRVYGLDPGAPSVCRFWSGQTFVPKSSHFYTPYAVECATVKQQGVWQFEGEVFALGLPVGPSGQGVCGTGAQPLYRAYNDGRGGAPNHRYTIDPALLDAMVAQGWVMEGEAATRVFACVPDQD